MEKYICKVCGNVYDPRKGDPENCVTDRTDFEDISEMWKCSVCSSPKKYFDKME